MKTQLKILTSKSAFTLIEVIIAVSIFVMLSVVSIANYRAGQRSEELNLAVREMVSVLRDLQVKSFTGKLSNLSGCALDPPPGGYGFKAHACNSPICQYYIFADCLPQPAGDNDFNSSAEEITPKPKLFNNITINFYKCPGGTCSSAYISPGANWINITFDLYQQRAIIKNHSTGEEITDEEFHIRLGHTITNKTKDIIIMPKTGLITF